MVDTSRNASDPFLDPTPRSEVLTRWVARIAVLATLGYLAFRIGYTLDDASPIVGGVVLAAEVFGALVFAARMRSASGPVLRPAPPSRVPEAGEGWHLCARATGCVETWPIQDLCSYRAPRRDLISV